MSDDEKVPRYTGRTCGGGRTGGGRTAGDEVLHEHGQSEDHGYTPEPKKAPAPVPIKRGHTIRLQKELAASERILGALQEEVASDKKAANEGDLNAHAKRAHAILGQTDAEYAANVLEVAGLEFPHSIVLLDPNNPMGFDLDLRSSAKRIFGWAERLLVWGEIGVPPHQDLFGHGVGLWGSYGLPRGEYPVPKIPDAGGGGVGGGGQGYVVRWLTWLGFDIRWAEYTGRVIMRVTPEKLASEAARLSTALSVHGIQGHVHATYRPATGSKDCLIYCTVFDRDFAVIKGPKS